MTSEKKFPIYHILVFLSCCGLAAATMGICVNAYGVFYSPVCSALGLGRGEMGVHATISGIAAALTGPIAVTLLGKIGVRRLVLPGVIAVCASMALMSVSDKLWAFNLLGLLRGVGMGCFYLPIQTVILGNWFHKWRGTVTGLALSFSGVAGAVFSPIMTNFIAEHGYALGYIVTGATIAALALPGALICTFRPEQKGLVPFGAGEEAGARGVPEAHADVPFRFPSAIFFIMAVIPLCAGSATGFTPHLPGVAESAGFDAATGALLISASMVGNIAFKFIIGFVNDHTDSFRACALMLIMQLCAMALMLLFPSSVPALLVAAFLYGSMFALGAVGTSLLARSVYGNEHYGRPYAIFAALVTVGNSLNISTFGFIYDLSGAYTADFAICLAMAAAAFACVWLTRKRAFGAAAGK